MLFQSGTNLHQLTLMAFCPPACGLELPILPDGFTIQARTTVRITRPSPASRYPPRASRSHSSYTAHLSDQGAFNANQAPFSAWGTTNYGTTTPDTHRPQPRDLASGYFSDFFFQQPGRFSLYYPPQTFAQFRHFAKVGVFPSIRTGRRHYGK